MLATPMALRALHHSMTPKDCSVAGISQLQKPRFDRVAELNRRPPSFWHPRSIVLKLYCYSPNTLGS
jgi:hypothetical protein